MKAHLEGNGTLVITPQTGTEEFALNKWMENFSDGDNSSMLKIDFDVKPKPKKGKKNG